MALKESIGWATRTWNPISGCWGPEGTAERPKRCFYCYAHRMAKRLKGRFGYPEDDPFKPTYHHDRLLEPLKRKKPTKIFICSMGSMFSGNIPTRYIDDILKVVGACPQHTFIVLTKQPENIERVLYEVTEDNPCRKLGGGDYFPNLWIGITCENQQSANKRIPILLQTFPAAVRFICIEPMLSEIDLSLYIPGLDWIIFGAMTGPRARDHAPHKEWIEPIVRQAREYSVPIYMKENLRPYWGKYLIQEWPVKGEKA